MGRRELRRPVPCDRMRIRFPETRSLLISAISNGKHLALTYIHKQSRIFIPVALDYLDIFEALDMYCNTNRAKIFLLSSLPLVT